MILAYHRVNPEVRDGLSVSPSMLESQIEWLQARGWKNVVLEDVTTSGELDAPDKSFAVTLDDGYQDNYFHAVPSLEKLGVRATVYLVSDMIDKEEPFPWVRPYGGAYDELDLHMTSHQIRDAMDRGTFVYGSHTLSHPFLTTLTVEEARNQITTSKRDLEQLLETEVTSFCYPAGDFTEPIVDLVGEAGYTTAVVTPNRHIPESMLSLHRVGVYSHITPRLFATKVNRGVRGAQHSRAFWWLRSRLPRPPIGRPRSRS